MNKKIVVGLLAVVVCALMIGILGSAQYQFSGDSKQHERIWHHELAADADVTLGMDSIPDDYLVDGSFTSHLPLVIIDTFGQEIINYKEYNSETDSFVEPEGIDPYFQMEISFIDNEDHVNTLADTPNAVSQGRIKVRGNSSASPLIPKFQYLIKLEDADGDNNPIAVFGMDSSDTWVLNGTIEDESVLRNYIGYNLSGELDPFSPDIRMCEAVIKRGEKYEYLGLFGIFEKVEQGVGRVDIPAVSNPISVADRSYILKRDRQDSEEYSIAVWSTTHGMTNNWINLEYPSPEKITEEYWQYIKNDIREVEDALYSEDGEEFLTYRNLLDIDSFVDYFIINEFLLNYDAGRNSTYMYKNAEGKISIGPVWDFDDAMDNNDQDTLPEYDQMVFQYQPWFNALVTDSYFNERIVRRYGELRAGVLSNENVQRLVTEAAAFIAKPMERDISRWSNVFERDLGILYDEDTELWVNRERDAWEDNIQKMKDVLLLHAEYMDKNLETDLKACEKEHPVAQPFGGWLLIIAFFVSIILVQRVRKGR